MFLEPWVLGDLCLSLVLRTHDGKSDPRTKTYPKGHVVIYEALEGVTVPGKLGHCRKRTNRCNVFLEGVGRWNGKTRVELISINTHRVYIQRMDTSIAALRVLNHKRCGRPNGVGFDGSG